MVWVLLVKRLRILQRRFEQKWMQLTHHPHFLHPRTQIFLWNFVRYSINPWVESAYIERTHLVGLKSPKKALVILKHPMTLFLYIFSHCKESCDSIRPLKNNPDVLTTAEINQKLEYGKINSQYKSSPKIPLSLAFKWAPTCSKASLKTSSFVTSTFNGTTDPIVVWASTS